MKRTITEIRESKRTGERMAYASVPDYTCARGPSGPAWTSRSSATASR